MFRANLFNSTFGNPIITLILILGASSCGFAQANCTVSTSETEVYDETGDDFLIPTNLEIHVRTQNILIETVNWKYTGTTPSGPIPLLLPQTSMADDRNKL
jgi:hypothetical protein